MRRRFFLLFAPLAAAAGQGRHGSPPNPDKTRIERKGKIAKVQIAPGAGMPSLSLDDGTRVLLGSMRYLIEKNFNPKAGDMAEVTGFKSGDDFIAISVHLPAQKRTIQLREDDGTPLWRGMWHGGRERSK